MPLPAELPHENIDFLLQRTSEEVGLFQAVGTRREQSENIGYPMSPTLALAELFRRAGAEGMETIKHNYFPDYDLSPTRFYAEDPFIKMPEEAQKTFWRNYAAAMVGIIILSLH